ncbi:MAG TPA: hypothetical protein VER35_00155, partial [Candidatus Limnocylindrales bacterium]|nr:hypothetical protein [Candidatus Limnocylindrales bacterium]
MALKWLIGDFALHNKLLCITDSQGPYRVFYLVVVYLDLAVLGVGSQAFPPRQRIGYGLTKRTLWRH